MAGEQATTEQHWGQRIAIMIVAAMIIAIAGHPYKGSVIKAWQSLKSGVGLPAGSSRQAEKAPATTKGRAAAAETDEDANESVPTTSKGKHLDRLSPADKKELQKLVDTL